MRGQTGQDHTNRPLKNELTVNAADGGAAEEVRASLA
jgi:hypothetical protein